MDWISASLVGLDISYHGRETTEGTNNTEYQAMKIKKAVECTTKQDFSKEGKLNILTRLMPWWNKSLKLVMIFQLTSCFFHLLVQK